MNIVDKQNNIERYNKRFEEFGYSAKALGWGKGKQDIRFDILTSLYNCSNKTILDIGCGFGDLNKTLNEKFVNYKYVGCDLCEKLIEEGKKHYSNAKFYVGDFLEMDFKEKIDWAVASGIFNHKFKKTDNYEFIENSMKKAFETVNDGFSFDFISDKVDFIVDDLHYSSPEKILSFAYKLSRNVILRNDYMPFEFSIFVFKDDSFDKLDTIFRKYKNGKNI